MWKENERELKCEKDNTIDRDEIVCACVCRQREKEKERERGQYMWMKEREQKWIIVRRISGDIHEYMQLFIIVFTEGHLATVFDVSAAVTSIIGTSKVYMVLLLLLLYIYYIFPSCNFIHTVLAS